MAGQTSDQDQDLLRAMLLFACSGLDAAMKATITDTLPTLADRDSRVQAQLETFAERWARELRATDIRGLARLLTHPTSPRAGLVEDFVQALTGGSLQSVDELHRVRAALGIEDGSAVAREINSLREVFEARNQISHEMDFNPTRQGRTRRHRGIRDMVRMADGVFSVGHGILAHVAAATAEGR